MKKLQAADLAGVTIAALVLGVTSASADGYRRDSVKDIPCCASGPWAGFYVGVHGGYGWKDNDFSRAIQTLPLVTIGGIDSKGALFGALAGHNWQYHSLVAGIELDFSVSHIDGQAGPISTPVNNNNATTLKDDVKYLGSARARLGLSPFNNLLLYGTGGLAWERMERTDTLAVPDPAFIRNTTTPFDRFGWVAGVGAEAKLGSNWMARLEYLHYDFGTVENATTFVSPGISSASEGGRQTIDVARAALSYKFGPHREASAAYGSGSIKDDPCCAAAPWAGFYLGVHGGYGWKDNSFSERINSSVSIPGIESEGRLFGAHAGYNWQYGSVVAGIEADFSSTNIRGETTVIQNLVLPRPITSADDVKYLGSARARLGFEAANNVLLYGTGGLAWERVERTDSRINAFQTIPPFGIRTDITTTPFDRFGWVAGVGAEAKLGSNWMARLEYLHYDFGMVESATTVISPFPTLASKEDGGHQRIDVVRAALSYKFGPHHESSAGYASGSIKDGPCCAAAPWAGFYAGIHGGYGWKDNDFSEVVSEIPTPLLVNGIESKGRLFGVQAGYNWQVNALVAGVELDFSRANIKGS